MLSNIDINLIYTYGYYHDCGKPFCIQFDSEGKRHFPNHSEVSYNTWKKYSDDEFAGTLIKHDLVLHSSNKQQILKLYPNLTSIQWLILIITGIAELHANANMFGGIESVGFKIKFKKFSLNMNTVISQLNGK